MGLISGTTGNDTLTGYAEVKDQIFGYAGNDKIYFQAGDQATGDLGADTYYLQGFISGTPTFVFELGNFYNSTTGKDTLDLSDITNSLSQMTLEWDKNDGVNIVFGDSVWINTLPSYIGISHQVYVQEGKRAIEYLKYGSSTLDISAINTFTELETKFNAWKATLGSSSGGSNGTSGAGNLEPTRPGVYTGGDSDDTVESSTLSDKINVGAGNNVVSAGEGNNQVTSGSGNDKITCGSGTDKITAGDGDNIINAGDGNNTVACGSGSDSITTGSGTDKITAGDGANTIVAGDGTNTITTGSGNDTITSGSGTDKITAGAGDDRIDSGAGKDQISGGTGADTFVFDVAADKANLKTISDFTTDDTLEFATGVFTKLAGATAADFVLGTKASDPHHYLIYESKTGKLYYDQDGSATGFTPIQIAGIKGTGAKDLSFADLSFV